MKVSVCIPFYNAATTLPRTLDALHAQTLQDAEFLLVDDGSTDESAAIAQRYVEKDARFRLFQKTNGGSASVRAFVWPLMQGEYSTVCDADDWIEPTMYEQMYDAAKRTDADMVVCDFQLHYEGDRVRTFRHSTPTAGAHGALCDLLTHRLPGCTWNKLVRHALYTRYGLTWEAGIDLTEDEYMLSKLLLHPLRLAYVPQTFYHYERRRTGGSYTNRLTLPAFRQLQHIHRWRLQHLQAPPLRKALQCASLCHAYHALRCEALPAAEVKEIVRTLLPCAVLLRQIFCAAPSSLSLKAALVLVARISPSAARAINRIFYPFVYR